MRFSAKRLNELHCKRLSDLLSGDLDFRNPDKGNPLHNFHSFPAKFPPQLPRKFIEKLTLPLDVVLDPMMGSGTTVIEAFLSGRFGVGYDIDPLALMSAKVKTSRLNAGQAAQIGKEIVEKASKRLRERRRELERLLEKSWDSKTKEFIDYWFGRETQLELISLVSEIKEVSDNSFRAFFELAFSAIIITKSGGVSYALDLAHTRPHRAKVVLTKADRTILENDLSGITEKRLKILTKNIRPAIEEFEKRVWQNLSGISALNGNYVQPVTEYGDAQGLPLNNDSADLIVTSPPYASNAIDYIRAHKFSLVWMGHTMDELSEQRKRYIGGESLAGIEFDDVPDSVSRVVLELSSVDLNRAKVLHRYYSEMSRVLREMFRVLKPGKCAIVVVGSSVMRGIDTKTGDCLAEIGKSIGFEVPRVGVRSLDRDRRMLPAGFKPNADSQIEQRMHQEFVVGFYKSLT